MTNKRVENEKKFSSWTNLPGGGRSYFYIVPGKNVWNNMGRLGGIFAKIRVPCRPKNN